MVDDESFDVLHSTFARILVDLDVSKGCLLIFFLNLPRGLGSTLWAIKGFPFDADGVSKLVTWLHNVVATSATCWKDTSHQHYMV